MVEDELRKQGGPAFPVSIPGCVDNGWQGMTLRDYFAGQALVGICGNFSSDPSVADDLLRSAKEHGVPPSVKLASICYSYADAMLLVRSQPKNK